MKKILLLITLLIIITACQPTPRVEMGDTIVMVEVVDDPATRQKGLMHREHLDSNAGMLFLFAVEKPLSFWMKNTLIPLDIIFINKDYEIIDIKTAVPCKEDPCKSYPSQGPALYVLEVNANFTQEHNIEIGDEATLSRMKPELLAPVSDRVMLKAAIDAGADCVYFGLKKLNMRATARNFTLEELPEIVKQCHDNNVKVFLTVNTIVYNSELEDVKQVIKGAKEAGVDYIICWDMAVINECKNNKMPFHISTQASVANTEAAKFYKELGADRIVLARECTLEQIKDIKKNSGIEIETFIHGAMCVSISGRCFMSQHLFKRSANRGDCLQPCRREYKIIDEENNELLLGENFVMSPKDLCALPFLDKLIEAGIDCFKIEGRVRSPEYVKAVTECYRKAIDAHKEGNFSKELVKELMKNLEAVYNRGFSRGFYFGMPTADDFADISGSKATQKKIYVGYITNYFKEPGVAAIKLEAGNLKVGDKIMIQGPTTGVQEQTVESMEINKKSVQEAGKGMVGIKLKFTARENDKVFIIEEIK